MVSVEDIVERGEWCVVTLDAVQMRRGVSLTVITNGARSNCGDKQYILFIGQVDLMFLPAISVLPTPMYAEYRTVDEEDILHLRKECGSVTCLCLWYIAEGHTCTNQFDLK